MVLSLDPVEEMSAFSSCLIFFPRILALTYVKSQWTDIVRWLSRWNATYISDVHGGSLNSKFFADLVLFKRLLQSTGWNGKGKPTHDEGEDIPILDKVLFEYRGNKERELTGFQNSGIVEGYFRIFWRKRRSYSDGCCQITVAR